MATTIAVAKIEGRYLATRFGDSIDESKFDIIFKVSSEDNRLEALEEEARHKARALGIAHVENLDPDPD